MSSSDFNDWDAATSRSSPNHIAQVVSKFGGFKRKIVTDIGFQGILQVPQINNLDRNFTLSLLNKIDIKKRCIRVNPKTVVEISAKDVHLYLDIPIGPNKLFGLEDRSESEKMDFIRFGIGSTSYDIDEKNSLKAAEEIIRVEYPNGMTEFQVDQFKVSFVCFAMGNFLLAKYSSNHGIKDFWGSLMNPSEIGSYNFCQAVADEILESARHIQRETKAKRTVKNISGCHLLLQAMYLDGISRGAESRSANGIPRIAAFNSHKLEEMINALQTKPKSFEANIIDNIGIKKIQLDTSYFGNLSSVSDAKSRKLTGKTSSSGCNLAKPASTEFLAAYTTGEFEKRLNDKQINDLRLHNARMKLFINNFKTKILSDINLSVFHNPTTKNMFEQNVDYLMNKVLDQVLVLSKSLHDHSEVCNPSTLISPSLHTSSKPSSGNITSGYESTTDCSSIKRLKTDSFPGGKNLLPELTNEDPNFASILHSLNHSSGMQLKSASESAYVTPEINQLKQKHVINDFHFTPTGFEKLNFANLLDGSGSKSNPSSISLKEDKFTTPIRFLKDSTDYHSASSNKSNSGIFGQILEEHDAIDLNEMPITHDLTYSPIIKIHVNKRRMARNPWFFGVQKHGVDKEIVDTLFNWLVVTVSGSLDSYWINHAYPKSLKIAGNDFKSVLTRGYNFTNDLLDLAIRRFGQMDRSMYGEGVNLRWSHIFESDFAHKVINEQDFLSSSSIRFQLTGKSQDYDISNCRMIAVPNITNLTWSSYFWDMKQHIVHVLDPTFDTSNAAEIHELHNPIVNKLQDGIQLSLAAAYDGWEIDWSNWNKNYVQPFLPGKKSNESGMLTLLALRQFNGTKFEIPNTEGSLSWFSKELLYNMLSLEGNRGYCQMYSSSQLSRNQIQCLLPSKAVV